MVRFGGMTDGSASVMTERLTALWQECGYDIWLKPRLLRNLLADLYPEDKKLINCMYISCESAMAKELLETMRSEGGGTTVQIRKFEAELHENYGLAWQYARWLVQVWEGLFCQVFALPSSRPLLQVATRAEVQRHKDMLPYYRRLERYEEYYQTAEALSRLNQAEGYYARGLCYLQGLGVEINYTEAYKSFQLAAEIGLDTAQYAAAVCLELGKGCTASYAKAITFYEKAADQGHEAARQQLTEIRRLYDISIM